MTQDDRMSVAGGGRDPRGGAGNLRRRFGLWMSNGRNEGPPDLDELWRDFNRKLSRLFGGKGGGDGNGPVGGNGGGSQPDMKGAGIGIGLVVGVVALGWLASGLFIVQEGQQGVVTSFGKYSRTVDAGIQYRFPYPFQSHEVVSVTQLRSFEIGRNTVGQATGLRDSSMLTQDENIIDVRFTVQFRLKNARDYLFENINVDDAVTLASESAVREIVGRNEADAVLYEKREQIAAELKTSIQQQLDRLKAGIEISAVNLNLVQPPEQVQNAFDDVTRAKADRERLKNDGEAYANDVIPRAQGQAARLREDAEAYRARVVSFAEGDAQRFKSVLAEYQKAPAVTRDRLYIDAMKDVYSRVSKVMVETKGGSNLLYLPLDKLIQQTSAGSVTTSAPTPVVPEATTSGATSLSTDPRSRDAMRSRDRDGR